MRTPSCPPRRCLVTLVACLGAVLGGCQKSADAPLVGVDPAPSIVPLSKVGAITNHWILHDGIIRTYKKYVPAGLPGKPVPLVFALHGGGGSAGNLSSSSHPWFEWRRLANRDKFIVVYPNGVDNNWHDCRSDTNINGNADDVGFISALIDEVEVSHRINLNRVYATGISNGGMMTYRLAAELSDRIAAVGAVVANKPVDPQGECGSPQHPTSVVIMNGDEDGIMPWVGGCINPLCRGTVLSAVGTRDYWIEFNAIQGLPGVRKYSNNNVFDGSTVARYRYTGGAQGTEVAFFRVFGGGHSTPSIKHHQASGGQNRDIEGIHEMWRILRKHTLAS